MNRSEQIGDLIAALVKAQSQFSPVPKNKTAKVKSAKTGAEYTYKYADLADVLSMALPILSANGIAFSQPHILSGLGKLRVTTMLFHSSGQWMQSDGIEISEDGDPQQFGAESTYFRRYDGCSFIGVAPDEDTDAQQSKSRKEIIAEAQAKADALKATLPPKPDLTARLEASLVATPYASQEPGMYDDPVSEGYVADPEAPGKNDVLDPKQAVSVAQQGRFHTICRANKKTEKEIADVLAGAGLTSIAHCPKFPIKEGLYDALCNWAQMPTEVHA